MKKITRYLCIYLLYIMVAVLGNVLFSHFQAVASKNYEGLGWVMLIYSLTVVAATVIIIFRTLMSISLHGKNAIIISCVLCLISAALFVYTLMNMDLYAMLPLKQDWIPYLILMLLSSDIFTLAWQLTRKKKA